jgi:hypothetical protein
MKLYSDANTREGCRAAVARGGIAAAGPAGDCHRSNWAIAANWFCNCFCQLIVLDTCGSLTPIALEHCPGRCSPARAEPARSRRSRVAAPHPDSAAKRLRRATLRMHGAWAEARAAHTKSFDL